MHYRKLKPLALVPLLLWSSACSEGEAQQEQTPGSSQRLTNVEVTKVRPSSLREYIYLPAYTEAWRDVMLASEQGGKLLELNVDKGIAVRQGQVLARLGSDLDDAHLN